MLTGLRIENIVLIENLTIEFDDGLCALTGETGAGKSILLDSLGLATGARSNSGLVRKGADQAKVTATFEAPPNHPAKAMLENQELEFEPTLVLRRTLSADGRSRAFINDQAVSTTLLKQIGKSLLEIHGQFDTQGLLDQKTHRQMLDDYAGIDSGANTQWDAWKTAQKKLHDLQNAANASAAEEEYLRTALEDLDTLEPQSGEEEKLAALRDSLMHREHVLQALNESYHVLNGEHDPVGTAWAALDRIADKMGENGAEIVASLDRASSEIQEAISLIQSASSDLEHSEHDLQNIDDRLFALRAQARKHECNVDDLYDVREALAEKLNAIEHADGNIEAQAKEVESLRAKYIKSAETIRKSRANAANDLDALVKDELPPLKLERAIFMTSLTALEESEWGPSGMDRVQFLVATNPGSAPGPINKIASGGEMSRFMLALKVVMAQIGSAGALVFDEVDAGIGGGTADAVGERLGRVAEMGKQVLVVTHSPQVAARAGHQWIVRKDGDENNVTTSILPLIGAAQRSEEIARMLAGSTITEEARAAANKLLENAATTKERAA